MVSARLLAPFLLAASLAAQGPATSPVNISGAWSLDVYLTDHPEQIARSIQFNTGEFAPATFREAEAVAVARGGRGGRGRVGQDPVPGQISAEDRKLLAELIRPIQYPPPSLMIEQQGEAVTITAGERATYTLKADGKGERMALESGTVDRKATWKGRLLHVAYEVGRSGVLTYAYAIVPTTGQLVIRVNFERVPGQPGPFEIKLVYNKKSTAGTP
jgi:hypothetical protein